MQNWFARLAAAFATLAIAGSAGAIPVLFNNGLAPPNPDNVFDDATHANDVLFIRNVGCDEMAQVPCASPGDPTAVGVVDGGLIDWLYIMDTSSLEMTGGSVTNNLVGFDTVSYDVTGGSVGGSLIAKGSSMLTMDGGSVAVDLTAEDSSTILLTGGTVVGDLRAAGDGLLLIYGSGFAVGGIPVPYGDLTQQSGLLTGTLQSGDPLSNTFKQGEDPGFAFSGTIRLAVPEPDTVFLFAIGVLGLAGARRRAR